MKQRSSHPQQSGFTLIEFSVVLVIIGLLVGAIFIGQDLVKASEYRNTISQLQSYDVAINTFQAKYGCLPGDCSNADEFFTGASNGDGDNFLQVVATPGNAVERGGIEDPFGFEYAYIWQHLGDAQLISGQYDGSSNRGEGFPVNSQGYGILAIQENSTAGTSGPKPLGHFYIMGTADQLNGALELDRNLVGVYTEAEMFTIDTKYDDGLPRSGNIYGYFESIIDNGGGNFTLSGSFPITYSGTSNTRLFLVRRMGGFAVMQ